MNQLRRTVFRSILLLAWTLIVIQSTGLAAERKPIGIVNFQSESTIDDPALAPLITSILGEDLITNRSFRLIDQTTLAQLLATNGLSANLFEKSADLQPDQLKGVYYLVTGKIQEANTQVVQLNGFQQLRARVLISIRVINVPAMQVTYAEAAIGEVHKTFLSDKKDIEPIDSPTVRSTLLQEAVKKALTKVSAKLHSLSPVTGMILQVKEADKTAVIDLGSEQNVSIGQLYRVFVEGDPIIHPITNRELGRETKEVATLKVTKVDTLFATAEITSGLLSEVHPGQLVKKILTP